MKTQYHKRKEAEARQEARDVRSSAAQIARLDRKFGVGVGAQKERQRLQQDA